MGFYLMKPKHKQNAKDAGYPKMVFNVCVMWSNVSDVLGFPGCAGQSQSS